MARARKVRRVKSFTRKAIEYGLAGYLSAFAATNAHIAYDHLTSNRQRIERGDVPQRLEVHRYIVNIDGVEKRLTLAGENHFYTSRENEVAKQLVANHSVFASESGSDGLKNMTAGNFVWTLGFAVPMVPGIKYYQLGSGRNYDSIREVAQKEGKYVHALENINDFPNSLSFMQKGMLAAGTTIEMFLSPINYYQGKSEGEYDDKGYVDVPFREKLVDQRDVKMAESIAALLKDAKNDNLLANIGRAHMTGVRAHLPKLIKLEEIK